MSATIIAPDPAIFRIRIGTIRPTIVFHRIARDPVAGHEEDMAETVAHLSVRNRMKTGNRSARTSPFGPFSVRSAISWYFT